MTTKADETKELTQEDFPHVTYNGIPLFFNNSKDDIKNILKVFNLTHFYVLGTAKEFDSQSNKTYNDGVRLFLVTNNTLGVSIQYVYESPLEDITIGTKLKLPKIPRQMIASIDAFFREVYKKNSTEGIVILTYDTAKEGAEGWGYIVPVQKNTSAHCDYEPQSVIDKLPNDTTIQVGTAHSHPAMKAYKSDTDQKDQLAFGDGIHMTFGWQASVNGGATAHYCEIQFGTYQQQVDPAYLFDDFNYEVDMDTISKEIEANVKKSTFQGGTVHSGGYHGGGTSQGSTPKHYGGAVHNTSTSKNRLANLPTNGPKKDQSTIVVPVYINEASGKPHCYGCSTELCPPEVLRHKCLVCKMPLRWPEETLDDVVAARKENKASYEEIDISLNPPFPIYIWTVEKGTDGKPDHDFQMIYTPGGDQGK